MFPTRSTAPVHRALLALAALSVLSMPAAAQVSGGGEPASAGPHVAFLLQGKLEMGGDRIATVSFEDGSEQHVVSGQGGTFAAGVQLRPNRLSPFAVRATAGVKYMTTKATNADIYLLRVPLELVGSYDVAPDVHVGAGFVHHAGIKFHGGGVGDDVGFKSASGGTAEVGWRWAALSYTKIEYTDESGNKYDASNAGLVFTFTFGGR